MAKLGKWIGGSIGWALGGPLGAFIGFVLGSFVDNVAYAPEKNYYRSQRTKTGKGDFVISLLVLTAAVMKADNKVLKSELNYVKKFLLRHFGSEQSIYYLKILREFIKQDIPLKNICLQIKENTNYHERLQLIHYLYNIAVSDGKLDEREIKIIIQISSFLNISKSDLSSISSMFVSTTDNDYKILGISKDASIDEIKNAYRKMAKKYHPDKVAHLGTEVVNSAKEKFQHIQNAYENIKKERGFY